MEHERGRREMGRGDVKAILCEYSPGTMSVPLPVRNSIAPKGWMHTIEERRARPGIIPPGQDVSRVEER